MGYEVGLYGDCTPSNGNWCSAGLQCVVQQQYYSQCLQGTTTAPATTTTTTTTSTAGFTAGCTTRYWDCCKSTFSWPGKSSSTSGVVKVCKSDGTIQANSNPWNSPADLINSYTCEGHAPIVKSSTLSYGFAAFGLAGNTAQEQERACACYHMKFSNTPAAGLEMVIQAVNTGDLTKCTNHFDLQIPGAGFGQVNCCINDGKNFPTRNLNGNFVYQYSSPAHNGYNWGPTEFENRGGVTSRAACGTLPVGLRAGCYWRFDWFKGADNPDMIYRRVKCPADLTSKSACSRTDDASYPVSP